MITVIIHLRKIGRLNKSKDEEKALYCSTGQPHIEECESVNNQNLQGKDKPYDTRTRK